MINIYIANLGAYTRGYLIGKWINLPLDESELKNEIEDILNGEEAKKLGKIGKKTKKQQFTITRLTEI